jgi:hypothetical protein
MIIKEKAKNSAPKVINKNAENKKTDTKLSTECIGFLELITKYEETKIKLIKKKVII